uniref:Uncharacterized protein n=1 Tax=Anguilla anguilla TaxID=7936 RepID=A0A0E9QPF7_ANGAN
MKVDRLNLGQNDLVKKKKMRGKKKTKSVFSICNKAYAWKFNRKRGTCLHNS